ncbi:Sec23/Sec24 trunk domain-containing protein [Cladochytrium replicatum]|nr:Sec23/Sec24 trunk domain-containing protein [Cladochytrium replicatum]
MRIKFQSSIAGSPMANCPPSYQRCTFNAIPNTTQLLSKCKIPLALVTSPFRHLLPGDEPVPVIQPEQIVRCRRCRTYINPWVQFVEQGTRWKCNLCYVVNEVPSFFDWDPETRQPRDRMKRVELTHSVIDFIAPQEYMVRPPQPVVFFFVIDVSYNAIQSGMVATAAKAILSALDSIPNSDSRTKVGIMTVDSTLHFYNLNAQASEPQMLVVADLEDVYLPLPEDLLVLLSESRGIIESLLGRIGDMFKGTQNVQNALGPALKSAYKLLSPIGGKIIVLQATLPTLHDGALKAREDSKLLGTPKEATLLQPASGFYKALAVDCSRAQVSVDLFAFSPQYTDIATLSGLAKYTGGSTYYYPGFNAARPEDALKFANELTHFLGRPLLLEAVLRVRASRGIRLTAFHGNFFLRSTDLLALPNVNPDNAYAIEMTLEENLSTSLACFQSAVLCTASSGERRIRVVTLAVPTTGNLQDCFLSTDQSALAVLLAKKAVERSLSSKIEDARDAIVHKLTDIMGAYKQNFTTSGQAVQLLLPENLKLLPLLILGLLKHSAFRATGTIPSDMRAHVLGLQYVFPLEFAITNIHPRFWALHNIDIQGDNNGEVVFPPTLNLTSAKLERHGLYLLETGMEIFLWVGRAVPQEVCSLLFDKPSYDQIPTGKVILPALQNAYSQKVNGLINKIRHIRLLMFTSYPHLYIVKEDGDQSLRMWFLSHLIEDRIEQAYSYPQWLGHLRDQMAKVSSG